jgi:hypothetical protein
VKEVKKGRGPAKDKVVDLKPETKADPADDGGVDLQSLADSLGIDL